MFVSNSSTDRITLMDPDRFMRVVTMIEKLFPGWWWSISQRRDEITFSSGPGRNVTITGDLLLAHSRAGDSGFIHNFTPRTNYPEHTVSWFKKTFDLNSWHRYHPDHKLLHTTALSGIPHRAQSPSALEELKTGYAALVERLDVYHEAGFCIKEVYLGSCDLTVDCSIRGSDKTGGDFDYSCDLGDDGILAESLADAQIELMMCAGIGAMG